MGKDEIVTVDGSLDVFAHGILGLLITANTHNTSKTSSIGIIVVVLGAPTIVSWTRSSVNPTLVLGTC